MENVLTIRFQAQWQVAKPARKPKADHTARAAIIFNVTN